MCSDLEKSSEVGTVLEFAKTGFVFCR